jgi:hypothetical protein
MGFEDYEYEDEEEEEDCNGGGGWGGRGNDFDDILGNGDCEDDDLEYDY